MIQSSMDARAKATGQWMRGPRQQISWSMSTHGTDYTRQAFPKDGLAAKAVALGEACGSFYMVIALEKNSVDCLYKVNSVMAPELVQVFHLFEASKKLSPG
jgi:hypothetical protein